MAFIRRNLVPINPATRQPAGIGEGAAFGAPCLWVYRTEDAAATVDTAGYFTPANDVLRVADVILRITVNSGGTPTAAGFHIVNQIAGNGAVDVTDALALVTTDTD